MNRSKIMRMAWDTLRTYRQYRMPMTFADALRDAWDYARRNVAYVAPPVTLTYEQLGRLD